MGKSSNKSLGKGEKASEKTQPDVIKLPAAEAAGTPGDTPQSAAADSSLPMVDAPKLGGEEAIEPAHADMLNLVPMLGGEEANEQFEAASEAAPHAAQARSSRFALLAATVALAAALGSLIGSLTASGISRQSPASEPSAPSANSVDAGNVLRAMKSQLAELAAIKASLDGAVRNANTQYSTIADRLDRVEHAAADPATKLAHISDAVDRLNKLNAMPETTGSIASAAAPTESKIVDRVLEDWIVQDVHGDRALVASRNGGMFDVGAGSILPGLGRVETVKRQDGRWVVVTARGLITSGR